MTPNHGFDVFSGLCLADPDCKEYLIVSIKNKTLLIVEDDPASLEALAEMSEALGAGTVLQAKAGREALSILKYEAVDIVLTDLHMRGGSGPDLIEAIRSGQAGEDQKSCPIIVLTGDVREGVREQIRSLGASGFVQKPVRLDELANAFGKVL